MMPVPVQESWDGHRLPQRTHDGDLELSGCRKDPGQSIRTGRTPHFMAYDTRSSVDVRRTAYNNCANNKRGVLQLTTSAVPVVKPSHAAHVPEEYITNLRVHDVHKSSWT